MTSSTASILPAPLTTEAPPTAHDSGADTAPGVILIHSCTTLGTTLVVRLAGEIDHFSAAPLRAFMASAADNGHTGLVLDCSRVTFCDSAFLAALEWWPRQGRRLRISRRSQAVERLLRAAAAASRPPRRSLIPSSLAPLLGPRT
ncbi:STAS domain-containing protein [Streptomyces sp. NRRL F-2664]|uniref:STAS domain-containing protein n=1 Tax=Streptomyces sp. NRRL F-2664 TaxID=1463842 RepID=UPI0004CB9764|nr:STAS domain-containing protein [Streptomyces sp. NRRL F-2664]